MPLVTANTFLEHVIRPVLIQIGMHSKAAEQLLLGTALQESGLATRRQHGGGPALSYYQMEPATHDDIWKNYLDYRKLLAQELSALLSMPTANKIIEPGTNDRYATGMARAHYARVSHPLPAFNDINAMGRYWKQYYNTSLGKGTAAQFVSTWNKTMGSMQ